MGSDGHAQWATANECGRRLDRMQMDERVGYQRGDRSHMVKVNSSFDLMHLATRRHRPRSPSHKKKHKHKKV